MPNQHTGYGPLLDRLWKKSVHQGECWVWTGPKNRQGYGRMSYQNRPQTVSRLAWEHCHGPIPDHLFVLHNCPNGDNPACWNPAHLWLGTQSDNMVDASKKGRVRGAFTHGHAGYCPPERRRRGTAHHGAKLTEEQVRDIRARWANRVTQAGLAEEFGVNQAQISAVVTGRSWSHIK